MGTIASQITSLTIVYSTVYSDADQRKHQSSASLAFVRGIHRGPVNAPHKWPVTRKMVPFDDVIMTWNKMWPDAYAALLLHIHTCKQHYWHSLPLSTNDVLTHPSPGKMAAIWQTTFSNAFFLCENDTILIKISPKIVPRSEVMACCRPGYKPLPESMMTLFIDAYVRY